MTTSNDQVWFYRGKKKLQRQISRLRMDQMLSDLLAWQVWLERTYSFGSVRVTAAGLRRLTIYAPGRPQRRTPSRTSVVLWLLGRRAEPHTTQQAPALKLVSFLPSMCRHWRAWVTCPVMSSQQRSCKGTAYCCGFLPSPLLSPLLTFFPPLFPPFSLTRGFGSLWRIGGLMLP